MTKTTRQRKPGKPPQKSELLTVAVVSLFIFLIAGYVAWSRLNQPFILKAKFDFADGLKNGAEVQFAGVKVGSVKDIQFIEVPPDSSSKEIFEVIFKIDREISNRPPGEVIRKDAVAVLIVTGALGDRSIDIVPGDPSAPPTQSGDYLRSRIEPTVSMVMDTYDTMNNNFDRVREVLEGAIKDINSGRGNIGKFYTKELNRNAQQLVDDAEAILIQLKKGKGTLGRFNSDQRLRKSLDRLQQQVEQLRLNFQQGKGSAGKFYNDTEIQQKLNLIETRTNRLSATLDRIMERVEKGEGSLASFNNEERFKRDFRQFRQSADNISEMIAKQKGTAGLLVNDRRLSENLGTISTEMIKLMYDIRQKPTKYVKFTLF